jgi:hypothetical protein
MPTTIYYKLPRKSHHPKRWRKPLLSVAPEEEEEVLAALWTETPSWWPCCVPGGNREKKRRRVNREGEPGGRECWRYSFVRNVVVWLIEDVEVIFKSL